MSELRAGPLADVASQAGREAPVKVYFALLEAYQYLPAASVQLLNDGTVIITVGEAKQEK